MAEFTFETIRHDSRGSEMTIVVTYEATPIVPAQTYGPAEHCHPAEGGEVTIIAIQCAGDDVQVDDAEYRELLGVCEEDAVIQFKLIAEDHEERRAEAYRESLRWDVV